MTKISINIKYILAELQSIEQFDFMKLYFLD